MSDRDELIQAVDAAAEVHSYAWVTGVLAGALADGWTAQRTAELLREEVAR